MTSTDQSAPLPFWPFALVDAVFLATAGVILAFSHRPLLWWEGFLLTAAVAAGAWSLLTPFLRRDQFAQAFAQAQTLADTTAKIQKLEALAAQISQATGQWQGVQEHATQTVTIARELTDTMTTEAKAFTTFLQKANDTEKAHLRLETEKLRRTEGDWIQVTVRILDNAFAMAQAAAQSNLPNVAAQIGQFLNVSREAARRVGLTQVLAAAGEPFDPQRHQLVEGTAAPAEAAPIAGTLAPGYTYQGQLLRLPLVGFASPEDTK